MTLNTNFCVFFIFLHRTQWKIINSVLNDKQDNCVIMATGLSFILIYLLASHSLYWPLSRRLFVFMYYSASILVVDLCSYMLLKSKSLISCEISRCCSWVRIYEGIICLWKIPTTWCQRCLILFEWSHHRKKTSYL